MDRHNLECFLLEQHIRYTKWRSFHNEYILGHIIYISENHHHSIHQYKYIILKYPSFCDQQCYKCHKNQQQNKFHKNSYMVNIPKLVIQQNGILVDKYKMGH
jgi:hypothetical protein